jgi:hypothetical protein
MIIVTARRSVPCTFGQAFGGQHGLGCVLLHVLRLVLQFGPNGSPVIRRTSGQMGFLVPGTVATQSW